MILDIKSLNPPPPPKKTNTNCFVYIITISLNPTIVLKNGIVNTSK